MKRLLLAAALIMAATQTPAQGVKGWDGNWLLEECNADSGACFYYIIGVTEGRSAQQQAQQYYTQALEPVDIPSKFCIPAGVTHGELKKAVHKHLRDNPEQLNAGAVYLIAGAIVNAWPCNK